MATISNGRKDRRFAPDALLCRIARSAVEKTSLIDHRDKSDCRGKFRQRSNRSRPKGERACGVLAFHPFGGAASRESLLSIVPSLYPTTRRRMRVRASSLRVPSLERLVRWRTNTDRREDDRSTFRLRGGVRRLRFIVVTYGCAPETTVSKYIASWTSRNDATVPSSCDALRVRNENAVRLRRDDSMMRAIQQCFP
jgi:hypothetical protein